MPTARNPHKGSMQFWHRVRAKRQYARIRNWPRHDSPKPLGFAGYKAGMTHAIVMDKRPNSPTKNEKISLPLTILECPPLTVFGYVTYSQGMWGKQKRHTIMSPKLEKHLSRKMNLPKQPHESPQVSPQGLCDVRLLVHTQPNRSGVSKKTPEVFEIGLGGKTVSEKLDFARGLLGKELSVADIFAEGQQVDTHVVTKGKGYQGPVRRFGVALRSHKSEKGTRGPGNVGSWTGNRSWTVSHAGQHGYHLRTEYNKWLIKISTQPSEISNINPAGGFSHYGKISNPYILLKGSVGGPSKRLVRFSLSSRPNHHIPKEAPRIETLKETLKAPGA